MAVRKVTKPAKRAPKKPAATTTEKLGIWDEIIALGKRIPLEEQDRLPRDLAARADEYLEGPSEQP